MTRQQAEERARDIVDDWAYELPYAMFIMIDLKHWLRLRDMITRELAMAE